MHFTTDQILAFAPDPNTAKRGQSLSSQAKWQGISSNGRLIWGNCKSSGAAFYETAVDLEGPAFKCNCPSRKFPCKHAIGLLLLSSNNSDGIHITEEIPEALSAWLDKRDNNKPTPDKERTPEEIALAEANKLKNRDKRIEKMLGGMSDLENWLTDLVRMGIAAAEKDQVEVMATSNYTYQPQRDELWETIAVRMVDAQLSGVGRRIRAIGRILKNDPDRPLKILDALSDLYLMARGFEQREKLPAPLLTELLTLAGVNIRKPDLEGLPTIQDTWIVVGKFESTNIDNATQRRTWFYGQKTNKFGVLLEYDYMNAGFQSHWPVGRIFEANAIYYPSAYPLRISVDMPRIQAETAENLVGYAALDTAIAAYSDALVQNPWLGDFPMSLENVQAHIEDKKWYIKDKDNNMMPMLDRDMAGWKIMALGAGTGVDIFGEWTGEIFHPLSVLANGRFIAL